MEYISFFRRRINRRDFFGILGNAGGNLVVLGSLSVAHASIENERTLIQY